MDATPPNPNKPRLSRRLLSHFTLTLSVLLALSFVTLAIIGPSTEEVEAGIPWTEVAFVGTTAATGAAAGAMVGGPLGAAIGGAGGAAIGAILLYMNAEKANQALSAGAKAVYARALANITTDYLGLANAMVDNLNTLWNTSQYYLVRKAEWAAQQLYDHQIANGLATVYDPYYVLSNSEVSNATASYAWAMSEQYGNILNGYSDLPASFIGTYDGMSYGLVIGGESNSGSTGKVDTFSALDYKPNRHNDFLAMARTYGSTYVTICADSDLYLVNTGANSATKAVAITHRNGTVVYSQSLNIPGAGGFVKFNLKEMGYESGDYKLSTNVDNINEDFFRWFGDFSKPISSSGVILPALISWTKNGENATLDFWTVLYNNKMYSYQSISQFVSRGSGEIYLFFDSDKTFNIEVPRVNITDCFRKLQTIIDNTANMQITANTFAQSYYNYLVANGPDAPRIMPDILFPDPIQMEGMSWQQVYAMLLAYLTQMDPWFEDHSVMGQDDVNISEESLDLLCRGAIYNASGGMVYGNDTVWTPYISLDDMTLIAGQNNTMTQPGFIIVWGSAADLDNFTRPTTCVYVPITAGWNLSIEEMTLKGAPVTQTTLTVTQIKWVVYQPGGNITMPQGMNDLDWIIDHWYYIAIIGGVICLLGAIATRNMPIMAAGLVLLAAGGIGWYLAGDTSLLDWLSIEPRNLTMWLQNLR